MCFNNQGLKKLHCIKDEAINGEIALVILLTILKKLWEHNQEYYEMAMKRMKWSYIIYIE